MMSNGRTTKLEPRESLLEGGDLAMVGLVVVAENHQRHGLGEGPVLHVVEVFEDPGQMVFATIGFVAIPIGGGDVDPEIDQTAEFNDRIDLVRGEGRGVGEHRRRQPVLVEQRHLIDEPTIGGGLVVVGQTDAFDGVAVGRELTDDGLEEFGGHELGRPRRRPNRTEVAALGAVGAGLEGDKAEPIVVRPVGRDLLEPTIGQPALLRLVEDMDGLLAFEHPAQLEVIGVRRQEFAARQRLIEPLCFAMDPRAHPPGPARISIRPLCAFRAGFVYQT